jgi:type I restriction enzyme S subunit
MSSKSKTTATREEAKPALVPKLRFPEFRGTEAWKETPFIDVLSPVLREQKKPSGAYTGLGLRSHGKGTFLKVLADPDKNSMEYLYEVKRDDLVVNITFAWEGAVAIAQASDDGALVSHRFPTYTFEKGRATPAFFRYVILDKLFIYQLGVISPGGAGRNRVLNKSDFLKLTVLLPDDAEQQKIAECLSSVDELIAAHARKVDALKTHKKGLMQKLFPREGETQPLLRFPEFREAEEWVECTVDQIIATVTPPKKLQTADYQAQGEYPIIDQSQDYICGWTSDSDAVIDQGLPVIVFGDHTCALKFIDRPFVQGADGIKIIRPKRGIDIRFLFCALEADPVVQESYKRHFSILKEKKMSYPDPKSGEQQSIASCLSSLDALITAETQKLEALKTHKKGLMQQVFPSPDEQDTL